MMLSTCMQLVPRLACVSTTPLGSPVVPPVYWNMTGSWSGFATGALYGSAFLQNVFQRKTCLSSKGMFRSELRLLFSRYSQLRGKESASSTPVQMKLRKGRRSRRAAIRGQRMSSSTMCSAPESCILATISVSMYRGLVMTTMAPALMIPQKAITVWGRLGIIRATRWPGLTPMRLSAPAKRSAFSCNSLYVMRVF